MKLWNWCRIQKIRICSIVANSGVGPVARKRSGSTEINQLNLTQTARLNEFFFISTNFCSSSLLLIDWVNAWRRVWAHRTLTNRWYGAAEKLFRALTHAVTAASRQTNWAIIFISSLRNFPTEWLVAIGSWNKRARTLHAVCNISFQ